MNIRMKNSLNKKENAEVRILLNACREKEPLALSFPFYDTETNYFFCYRDKKMVSVLVLCRISSLVFECTAWTHPDSRKKGCFNAAWKEARRYLYEIAAPHSGEKIRIRFIIDHCCPAAMQVIRSLKARKKSEELIMSAGFTESRTEALKPGLFDIREIQSDDNGIFQYGVFLTKETVCAVPTELPVLSFSVMPAADHFCYLFRLSVRKGLRHQGYGSRIFPLILQFLKNRGYSGLMLQVSSSNKAAVKIYKDSGLTAGVRLTYYEITI
jgi:ribosomal protein S18 acetylase RimI-like enzyme